MGKLNVTMLRYLSKEDFRVLTAVRVDYFLLTSFCTTFNMLLYIFRNVGISDMVLELGTADERRCVKKEMLEPTVWKKSYRSKDKKYCKVFDYNLIYN